MSCESVREWNGAVLLGEASGDPPEALARHLASCARCRGEVEEARAAWQELALLTESPEPARAADTKGARIMSLATRGTRAAVVALALLAGTAVGWTAGRSGAAEAPAIVADGADVAGSAFLLLIRETPATVGVADEVGVDALVAEYGAWAGALAEAGRLIGAEKLAEDGTRVSAAGSETVDGVAPGAVSGYFLVRAPDAATALEIARRSPHVRHGGVVEVRAIDTTTEG